LTGFWISWVKAQYSTRQIR